MCTHTLLIGDLVGILYHFPDQGCLTAILVRVSTYLSKLTLAKLASQLRNPLLSMSHSGVSQSRVDHRQSIYMCL